MTDIMLDLEYNGDGICIFCNANPVGEGYVDMCNECVDAMTPEDEYDL